MQKVLIFGLGGIGGVYACALQAAKLCDVHVVARSNYQMVKDKGMRLISPLLGDSHVRFSGVWKDCQQAADSGTKYDYIICSNKALLDAKPSLSEMLRPVVSPKTVIAIFQNGVGAEEPLHAAFPDNAILSAVKLPEQEGVPMVEQFNQVRVVIGVDGRMDATEEVKSEERESLDRLVGVLKKMGDKTEVTNDIQSARWGKVIWNCCLFALTTPTRLRSGPVLDSSPQASTLAKTMLSEVATVARAKGLNIPEGLEQQHFETCKKGLPGGLGFPTSMMVDGLAGRPLEVESIFGTPLREAERLGIPVPTLFTMYTLIKAIDYGNQHPDLRVDGK